MKNALGVAKYLLSVFVFVFFGGVAAARMRGASVGRDCRIYVFAFGSEPFLIRIGDRVTITSGVRLITHDGATSLVRDASGRRQRFGPVKIGDDVFIGGNSLVMPGVTIGSRVIVGAGSVVTRDIPDNSVVAGNPARILRTFDQYEQAVFAKFGPLLRRKGQSYEEAVQAWLASHAGK